MIAVAPGTITDAEARALEVFLAIGGRPRLFELARLLIDVAGILRDRGAGAGWIREYLTGHAHDWRHLSETDYFVRRLVIRLVTEMIAEADGG